MSDAVLWNDVMLANALRNKRRKVIFRGQADGNGSSWLLTGGIWNDTGVWNDAAAWAD